MEQTAHLWLYFAMVLGVILLPGLDMAYVMASSLAGGRRSGLVATSGIIAGGVFHVAMGAFGLMAVLSMVPAAFNALLLAGAAYIAWIGWTLLRSSGASGGLPQSSGMASQWATFRRGMVTCLLNPKAYLFMLAIFPQFLKPEYGSIAVQALALAAITAATQAGVYGAVAIAGGGARGWLESRPGAGAWLARGVGGLLMAAAAITALEGWRGP